MELRTILPAFFFLLSAVGVRAACAAASSRTGPKVTEKVGDGGAFICVNPEPRLLRHRHDPPAANRCAKRHDDIRVFQFHCVFPDVLESNT